jgi:hypothetical protein
MSLNSDDRSADSNLIVRFYQREVKNEFLSEEEGRPIYYMADYINISVSGDRNNIIDTIVNKGHIQRFPIEWARYQNDKSGKEDTVVGTMLKDWDLVTPAIAAELRHYNFLTVEQVANASDEQISKTSMIVGMSGHSFRDRAKAFLAASKRKDSTEEIKLELMKRDAEMKELKEQLANLTQALTPKKRATKENVATMEE